MASESGASLSSSWQICDTPGRNMQFRFILASRRILVSSDLDARRAFDTEHSAALRTFCSGRTGCGSRQSRLSLLGTSRIICRTMVERRLGVGIRRSRTHSDLVLFSEVAGPKSDCASFGSPRWLVRADHRGSGGHRRAKRDDAYSRRRRGNSVGFRTSVDRCKH